MSQSWLKMETMDLKEGTFQPIVTGMYVLL